MRDIRSLGSGEGRGCVNRPGYSTRPGRLPRRHHHRVGQEKLAFLDRSTKAGASAPATPGCLCDLLTMI